MLQPSPTPLKRPLPHHHSPEPPSSIGQHRQLKCRKRKRRAEDDPVPAKVVLTNRELK
jgi:hypothetical protein